MNEHSFLYYLGLAFIAMGFVKLGQLMIAVLQPLCRKGKH